MIVGFTPSCLDGKNTEPMGGRDAAFGIHYIALVAMAEFLNRPSDIHVTIFENPCWV